MGSRSAIPATTFVVVFAVVAGLALRLWVVAVSPLGVIDADEAVTGLMALHALDGEFSVFFWLQPYGGAQNAWLAAPVLAVAGASVFALKAVHVVLVMRAGVTRERITVHAIAARWVQSSARVRVEEVGQRSGRDPGRRRGLRRGLFPALNSDYC